MASPTRYRRALITLALMAMTSHAGCSPGDGKTTSESGDESGTTMTAMDTTSSTSPTSTGTTGPAACAALTCTACATCQRDGACSDLYATCSADADCLANVNCIIPACIEQGPLGEACVEMCMNVGDPLAAADYLDCVSKVCDPACGF
jgi:hypothetical protein